VEDIATRARLPMPRLYLIPSQQPNAFATGRSPKHSAVAVTDGLLALMPRDQVRGVLAHELAHIRNRDVLVTTIAAMIGAAISAVANFLQFQWLFGGDDDESPLGFIGTIAAIIIAPIAAMLLQFAVSRQREFLADQTAAELLGEGRPLADALGTLQRGVEALPMQVNPATASLYIASPLGGRGMSALFSTHPPIAARIERLHAFDAARGL
jgi:heat shock protein HtpX